jgi:transcriptional regulator NrdR family protein
MRRMIDLVHSEREADPSLARMRRCSSCHETITSYNRLMSAILAVVDTTSRSTPFLVCGSIMLTTYTITLFRVSSVKKPNTSH